jgi:Fungalysin metallopeptidase (M36)
MAGMSRPSRLGAAALAAGGLLALTSTTAGADPRPQLAARAEAPMSQLATAQPVAVPGGAEIHRYRQRVDGLPVLDAEAVVVDSPGGAPTLVADHTVAGLDPSGRARLSRSAAVERAMRATAASDLRARTTARLAVDPGSESVVWRVLIASGKPLADYEVRVDAADGKIVRIHDLLHYATGSALLYVPNPVVEQGRYAGLKDRDDRDSSLLNSLRQPVTLERLSGTNGCLEGQYVRVTLGRGKTPVCAAGADFTAFTRHSDKFEALMAYYHIDRTRAYIDSLGLTRGLSAKPQKVRADSLTDDNSFFSPRQRTVSYGTGGVDDAEDADVIIHEYGHSVQDQSVHLFGKRLQGASMGEGFADYLAAVMSSQATGGNAGFDPCMFEWDATSYTKNTCARRTDKPINVKTAKRRCGGDPHCIGELWSGALWKLRAALGIDLLGRSIIDRDVLESHFMLTRTANFREGARALLAADQSLYGGANAAAITAELVSRGLCPASGC